MRTTFSAILLVLAALLSIPAVTLLWVQKDIINQGRYIAIAERIAADPAAQTQVVNRVTDTIMEKLPIDQLIQEARGELPPRLSALFGKLEVTLTATVDQYVNRATTKLVTSEQFARLWEGANRTSHKDVLKVLRGQGDSIVVDLWPVVDAVKTRLLEAGFDLAARIPEVHPQFTLATSPRIAKARNLYPAFEVLRWLVPVLTLLCLAGGIALAHNRLQALMWGAVGIALAMGVAGGVTWLLQGQIADGRAVYDAFVTSYHSLVRWVLLIAVAVAAVAYLIEYSRTRKAAPPQES